MQIGKNGHEAPEQLKTLPFCITLSNELYNHCTRRSKKIGVKNVQQYITFLISKDFEEVNK